MTLSLNAAGSSATGTHHEPGLPVALVDFTGAGGGQSGMLRPFYYLKDALGSVGALTDASGAVVERYTYSPYGQTSIAAPDGTSRPVSEYWNPFLWTGQRYDPANELYHFWARTYDPQLGRFLQEDEQGPLAPMDVSLSGDGDGPGVSAPSINAGEEYLDGLMLYLYAGANPVNVRDPFGLSDDEYGDQANDEYGDLMSDLTGHKVATLGYIQDSAAAVGLGIRTSLNIAGSLLGVDVFQSVVILASGGGGFWEAMDIVLSLNPAGRVFKLAGKAAVWARRFARAGKALDAFRDAAKYGIKP